MMPYAAFHRTSDIELLRLVCFVVFRMLFYTEISSFTRGGPLHWQWFHFASDSLSYSLMFICCVCHFIWTFWIQKWHYLSHLCRSANSMSNLSHTSTHITQCRHDFVDTFGQLRIQSEDDSSPSKKYTKRVREHSLFNEFEHKLIVRIKICFCTHIL